MAPDPPPRLASSAYGPTTSAPTITARPSVATPLCWTLLGASGHEPRLWPSHRRAGGGGGTLYPHLQHGRGLPRPRYLDPEGACRGQVPLLPKSISQIAS